MKITNLTDDHLQILQNALNLYFRIGMGQIEEVFYNVDSRGNSDLFLRSLQEAKRHAFGFSPGQSYSISSVEPDDFRSACDMHDAIRYFRAKKRGDSYSRVFQCYPPDHHGNLNLIEVGE